MKTLILASGAVAPDRYASLPVAEVTFSGSPLNGEDVCVRCYKPEGLHEWQVLNEGRVFDRIIDCSVVAS